MTKTLLFFSDNHRQNIRNKVKKSSKIGQNWKILTSAFVYFLTTILKGSLQIRVWSLSCFLSCSATREVTSMKSFLY